MPINWNHYRFLRKEPEELRDIPFAEELEPPPLENRYRVVAYLLALATISLVTLAALA